MKSTGIIRRIDDLGRIVIPKEIRRQLRIREDDPLEFHIEGSFICLKKYNPYVQCIELLQQLKGQVIGNGDLPNTQEVLQKIGELEVIMNGDPDE